MIETFNKVVSVLVTAAIGAGAAAALYFTGMAVKDDMDKRKEIIVEEKEEVKQC